MPAALKIYAGPSINGSRAFAIFFVITFSRPVDARSTGQAIDGQVISVGNGDSFQEAGD
ncbi:MAG: hypothetical protein ABJA60_10975 [Nitrosospira sp.]